MGNQEKEVPSCLGDYIKFARIRKGLSLKVLSEKSKISISYLSRLENNERIEPSFSILKQLAKSLEFCVLDLLEMSIETNGPKTKDIRDILLDGNYTIYGKEVQEEVRILISEIIEYIFSKECYQEGSPDILHDNLRRKIKYLNEIV